MKTHSQPPLVRPHAHAPSQTRASRKPPLSNACVQNRMRKSLAAHRIRRAVRILFCGAWTIAAIGFSWATVNAQEHERCGWGQPIRISVLFDNSGTVIGRQHQLIRRSEQWMQSMMLALRPGDRFQVFGLLNRPDAQIVRLANVDLASTLRWALASDSAEAFSARVFDTTNQVDTTDLRQSMAALQSALDRSTEGFCGDVVILVTDGALSPFRERSGMLPSPTTAVDSFINYIRLQRKGSRRRYYAVSIGAERAIDRFYERAWEKESHGEIASEISEMGGSDLLGSAFGRVFKLDLGSLNEMMYRDTSSVFPSLFGLARNTNSSLSELIDRRLRYLLIELGVEVLSLCREDRPDSTFAWTLAGDRCMLHTSTLSASLLQRLGRNTPWFMYSQELDSRVLPDTIVDLHQMIFPEPGFDRTQNCDISRLLLAVSAGTYDSAEVSVYSLRYRFISDSGQSPSSILHLKRLRSTGCLVAADLVGEDPGDASYNAIKIEVERDDGRTNPVIFSEVRQWRQPSVLKWKFVRIRSLASSFLFHDRWLVSGWVITRRASASGTQSDTSNRRVYIGANRYPLSTELPDTACAAARLYIDGGTQCESFGGLYTGAHEPGRAVVALTPFCEDSPHNCHFASLTSISPILHLSSSQVVLWVIIGISAGILFHAKRCKSYRPGVIFQRSRWKEVTVTAAIGALFCVWMAESVMWTPSFLPFGARLGESLIPTLMAILLMVFPSQLRAFVHLFGMTR